MKNEMENVMEMKLDVLPELLAVCERVEVEAKSVDGERISWAFFPQTAQGAGVGRPAQGAVGFTEFAEYNVSTWLRESGEWSVSAYWRTIGKYDNDNWETHKVDDDYEDFEEVV
jgi:hypothetical protein